MIERHLSDADSLRLNVLATNARAIRIDESRMEVRGLGETDDHLLRLSPTCGDEKYLRLVRQWLSTRAMGSPEGYPVFLSRWTRMGQLDTEHLARLLLLGEPEAVVAVASSPGLTDELASRAWWALPSAEVARLMLERETVFSGETGPVLARALIDHLPFEQDPGTVIQSVRCLLKPGLISPPERDALWRTGERRAAVLVGFLRETPHHLPGSGLDPGATLDAGIPFSEAGSLRDVAAGRMLSAVSSTNGAVFLDACQRVMRRAENQDVVVELFEAIGQFFAPCRRSTEELSNVDEIRTEVDAALASGISDEWNAAFSANDDYQGDDYRGALRAILFLAHVGEPLIRPLFARTTAVGGLMRRKAKPIFEPIEAAINALQAVAH